MLACAIVAQLNATPKALSQCRLLIAMINAVINAVLDKDTGELMEYRRLMKNPKYRPLYRNSYAKELGHLTQGMPGLADDTNTIFFIPKKDVSFDRWHDVTYGRIVVNYRPEKTDPYCTRLTVGGDGTLGEPSSALISSAATKILIAG